VKNKTIFSSNYFVNLHQVESQSLKSLKAIMPQLPQSNFSPNQHHYCFHLFKNKKVKAKANVKLMFKHHRRAAWGVQGVENSHRLPALQVIVPETAVRLFQGWPACRA
jgi:hypothetical protein